MCLGCIDDSDSPPTRREFLAAALQLTAASALGTTAVADAAARVWDIEGRGLTIDNAGTLLPAYTAVPMGASNRTTVVILHDSPGITKELQDLARDVARTGYVSLVIDCAQRGTAKISTHPDALLSEAFSRDVQSDVRAGIVTLNGSQPNANPVVIFAFGGAGYTALRMALNDPLGIVGVIAMYTPIETPVKSNTDPRPDLITLLARLNVPVQFHAGTADPAITREQMNWLGRFVAVEPDRRELFLYGGAGPAFYMPSSQHYDQGYQVLAKRRWQEFLARRFS
ncbi:MAG TPA: dienelactone hydrolase family protein [Steroidobacter sp.]|uniref:dienelactone hydrolase family protein n=1 Tax=Steroidobacter sp. TaxID=1978227 RepID=UPI002EDB6668